jgi:hypothetical protein
MRIWWNGTSVSEKSAAVFFREGSYTVKKMAVGFAETERSARLLGVTFRKIANFVITFTADLTKLYPSTHVD